MPRQQRVRAVAQVCAQPGAGGNRVPDACPTCCRVTQGDDDSAAGQLLDEAQRALMLGSQRDQANPAARGILQPAKLVPVGWPNMLPGMSAARPVLRRDVRPFEMNGGNRTGNLRSSLAGPPQG